MSPGSRRGALLLSLTFAVGVLGGVALDRWLSRDSDSGGTRIMLRAPQVLERLDLTPAQRRAADSILAQSSPRSEALMREMVPRLSAIADSVNEELKRVLTPEQRARLDSLIRTPIFLLKRKGADGASRIDTIRRP